MRSVLDSGLIDLRAIQAKPRAEGTTTSVTPSPILPSAPPPAVSFDTDGDDLDVSFRARPNRGKWIAGGIAASILGLLAVAAFSIDDGPVKSAAPKTAAAAATARAAAPPVAAAPAPSSPPVSAPLTAPAAAAARPAIAEPAPPPTSRPVGHAPKHHKPARRSAPKRSGPVLEKIQSSGVAPEAVRRP